MTPVEPTEKKNIFVMITEGIPKPIVYTLICAIVIGAITFSFAFVKTTDNTNKELPEVVIKTTLINEKVDLLTIDNAVVKVDISNLKKSVVDVGEELKSQREILLQILYRTNQINNNTK